MKLLKIMYPMSFNYPCPRKLREVMKMSLIEREPAHVVKDIWLQYHEPRISNSADVIEKDKYLHIVNKANRSPMFMLPVNREGGHFKLISQWQDNCFLCTYMQDFKRYGRNAQPYIVFTFFTELMFKKGIILVRSDVINNSMTKAEAINCWQRLLMSYLDEHTYELVDKFNHHPDEFNLSEYDRIFSIQ